VSLLVAGTGAVVAMLADCTRRGTFGPVPKTIFVGEMV